MIIMFLDAMASLEFMLENERVGDVFGILSNLGHIFRVCSVFYGKHCQRHNSLKYRVVLLKKLLKVVPQALNQNLALTSSILKYMCRAERPFLFQQIQMIQKYLNHFSLQSVSHSLVFEEKEKFDENFVWLDSYDDNQGDCDDKIEKKVDIWMKIYTFDGYTVLLCT